MLNYLTLGVSAAGLAVVVTPVIRWLARRFGIVDEPGARRLHRGRVPRLGGLALLVAMLGTCGLAQPFGVALLDQLIELWSVGWLLSGALTVVIVGAVDDVCDIGPLPKLAFETLAGGFALAGGCGFDAVTNPITGGAIPLGPFGGVVAVLWIVAITNAFNLIDGLDGLAAGVGLIATGTILAIALAQGRPDTALLAMILAGALAGFLVYNFHPASIFLGDSGSLLIGYLTSVLAIQAGGKGATAVVVGVPILALGLPILDTLVTVWRRLLFGGSGAVFQADREHIHHRLLTLGMTQRRAVLVLYGVSTVLGGFALLAALWRGPAGVILIGLALIASYAGVRRLGYPGVEHPGRR